MTDRDVKSVITRDRSSQTVHLRLYVNGQLMSDEQDNLDDAGEYDVLQTIENIPDVDLCQRCFPRDPSA